MFKLIIECTKDIDEIHIDFSDGSSVVKSKEPIKEQKHQSKKQKSIDDTVLKTDDYENNSVFTEEVEKPVIEERERPVKVASELQNLDF